MATTPAHTASPPAQSPFAPRLGWAWAALGVSALGWALAPVFIRYLSPHYDPYTQSFVRYASAAAALTPWCALFYPCELRQALGRWRALLGISAVVVLMQTAWTVAIYSTTATSAQLVTKLQVPMVALLSYAAFREERGVIRDPRFLAGAALSLFGVWGVLLKAPGAGALPAPDLSFWLLMLVNVCWAVYIVASRHACRDLHPVPMFTVVGAMVTLGFLPVMLWKGDAGQVTAAGPAVAAVAFLSGAVSISLSHSAFHYAQVRLGAAFCTTLHLLNPLATYAVAFALWPDEAMNAVQWAGAALLIGGSALVVRARRSGDGEEPGPT